VRGEPLARLRVRAASDAPSIVERVRGAFDVADTSPQVRPLVLDRISSTSSTTGGTSG